MIVIIDCVLDNWPSIHMLVGFENNFASWPLLLTIIMGIPCVDQ